MIDEKWCAAQNILAVRLDNIGDVIMLGPALRAVKETSPHARLTLLASPAGTSAVPLLPWIDDVITWRPVWQDVGGRIPFDPVREQELIHLLAERKFDAALIFTSFSQTPHTPGYVCYLAGIPLRAGESKEFGGSTLTTELKGAPDELHQVERNLRLVEHLGFVARDRQLVVSISDEARASVPGLLKKAGISPERPYILLHPGASAQARRYPAKRFGILAHLLTRQGFQVLITGTEREAALIQEVTAHAPKVGYLIGGTTLSEYAALIDHAMLVICNNTLPMHLADAVRTPEIVLFSGTDYEEQWRPRATRSVLLRRPTSCYPCYLFECPIGQLCLDISPEEVLEEVNKLLGVEDVVSADSVSGRPREGGAGRPQGIAPTMDGMRIAVHSWHSRGDPLWRGSLGNFHGPPSSGLPTPMLNWSPKRIAIFRALQLGDLLVTVPALRALRAGFPKAEITLIGLPWAKWFVERFSHYLDRFVEFPGYPGIEEVKDIDAEQIASFLEEQSSYGYDLVIQMHGDGRISNAFALALGARVTIGYYQDKRPAGLALGMPYPNHQHEVRRNLSLMALLGCSSNDTRLEFPVFNKDRSEAARLLRKLPRADRPWIGIHAGARPPSRRWPPEYFAAVADEFAHRFHAQIILTGGPGEEATVQKVVEHMVTQPVNLAGKTSLGGLAALISELDLFVSNDTGPVHIAYALDTPSITIFGPADPVRWAPLDQAHHSIVRVPVACSPCTHWECPIDHACLLRIRPNMVIEVAEDLLLRLVYSRGGSCTRPGRLLKRVVTCDV